MNDLSIDLKLLVHHLESLVHQHSKYVKRCRFLVKGLKKGTITVDEIDTPLRKLIKTSRRIEKILQKVAKVLESDITIDPDISERLKLLTFYIIEVSINEEGEVWQLMSRIDFNAMGYDLSNIKMFDSENHMKRIDNIKSLALKINSVTYLIE